MVAVAVVTAAWCALGTGVRSSHGAQVTGDEPYYLLTALSLFEDGDLDIADELTAERWRDFHEAELPEQTKALDDSRSRLSPHDPLLPVVLAVPMGLGGWVGARLAMAAMAGMLAAAVLWVAVRRFAVPPGIAIGVTLAFALSPPLAVYGTQIYPELPAALVTILAVAAATGPLDRRGRVALAVAVVALPWLAVKYVPVAAAVIAVAVVRMWRRGDRMAVSALAGVLAVAAGAFVIAHLAWYGGVTPYAAGDHFVGGEFTVAGHDPDWLGRSRRLAGLLVDRDFGLAGWQPAWLLAVPAIGALVARRPPGWTALTLPLAAGWLTATFAALTMHGWWFPGRQVVVILPLAAIAIASWIGHEGRPKLLVFGAVALFGIVSYGWLVVDGIAERITWAVDFFDTSNPLVWGWRLALPDERPPVGRWPNVLHAAWSAAAVLALVLSARRGRHVLADRHEDPTAREGADADVTAVDLHGDRPVGRGRGETAAVARHHR